MPDFMDVSLTVIGKPDGISHHVQIAELIGNKDLFAYDCGFEEYLPAQVMDEYSRLYPDLTFEFMLTPRAAYGEAVLPWKEIYKQGTVELISCQLVWDDPGDDIKEISDVLQKKNKKPIL